MRKGIGLKKMTEFDLHMENLQLIMRCSNATPAKIQGLWYKCSFCYRRYEDPTSLKMHTLENHRNGTPSVGRNISELAIRLDVTELQCSCCGLNVKRLEHLIKHLSEVHSESLHTLAKNYIAPFSFDADRSLRCGFCELQFFNSKMLFIHMNNHYDNFTCDECSATFLNQRCLYNHAIRHANGQYQCELCDGMFDNPMKLKDHTNSIHRGMNKRNKCDFCEERFNCIIAKRRHLVQVHGVELPDAKCTACEKTFKSYKYLTVHQRRYHMMERRYPCTDCEKRFVSKDTLKRHMLTHSGEREFKCPICSKEYGRNSTLKQHMRIHADDRRYKCRICGIAFVQKCTWKVHMRIKHGEDG